MRPKNRPSDSGGGHGPSSITLPRMAARAGLVSATTDNNSTIDGHNEEIQEILENDLICPICQDIMINPLILNCAHSFCKFCVYRWLSTKTRCPQCRMQVSFQAENLALRNIINKMVLKLSPQYQKNRSSTIEQRLKDEETLSRDCPLVVVNKEQPAGRFRMTTILAQSSTQQQFDGTQSGYLARPTTPVANAALYRNVMLESDSSDEDHARSGDELYIELRTLTDARPNSEDNQEDLSSDTDSESTERDLAEISIWGETDDDGVEDNSNDMDYNYESDREQLEDSYMDSEDEILADELDRYTETDSDDGTSSEASSSDTELLDCDEINLSSIHPMSTRNNSTIELDNIDDDDTSDDDYVLDEDDDDDERDDENEEEVDTDVSSDSESSLSINSYSSSNGDEEGRFWVDSDDDRHSSASSSDSSTDID